MQHVVFGAGLIGGFLAGALLSKGEQVSLVARPSVQQRLANGLHLTDYEGHEAHVAEVPFVDSGELQAPPGSLACEYLWLTVKCTSVEAVSLELDALVGPNTKIFCVQNGLGSEQCIRDRYPDNRVMRVMTMYNVAEPREGHLHRGSEGHVSIEELAECPQLAQSVATRINCALMPTQSCPDMNEMLWAKLQLNLANAVNALGDVPVKAMTENPDFRKVIALLMTELLAVVAAKNMKLPAVTALPAHWLPVIMRFPNFVFLRIAQKMLAIDPTVRTSMWWDLDGGRPTEIDYLNGAVVDEGKKLGVACPANEKIVDLIHQVEQGQLHRGINPADLLKQLKGIGK
jgi:2-dehydropantoate 2-reductase